MSIIISDNISCKLNDGKLHSKAKTEERNVVLTGELDRVDHTFDTTVSESTGNDDTVNI